MTTRWAPPSCRAPRPWAPAWRQRYAWRVTRILAGTCGFSYRAWRGRFYALELPASEMLASYGRRLPTVEIDSTFYRPPAPTTLASWYLQTPAGFCFALKAPREITHERRLAGVATLVRSFYESAAELEEKLGPVLFQLPPTLERDLPLLRDLLSLVPRGGRTALEFRHPSWRDDAVLAAMRDAGAAVCITNAFAEHLVATARFGYLRLALLRPERRVLVRLLAAIRAQPWEEAFVFFKDPSQGRAPAVARALSRLA